MCLQSDHAGISMENKCGFPVGHGDLQRGLGSGGSIALWYHIVKLKHRGCRFVVGSGVVLNGEAMCLEKE